MMVAMITMMANIPRIDRDDTAIMNHSGRNTTGKCLVGARVLYCRCKAFPQI